MNFFSEDTDWSGLEHELKQQDWVSEFRSLDPQQMLDKNLEICTAVSLKYVPIRKIDGSSTSKSQGQESLTYLRTFFVRTQKNGHRL